jgi:hypothetical protein
MKTRSVTHFDLNELKGYGKEENRLLKQGIWLYFFLLIFEGALRKWILPEFATLLLIVRDPLAIGLILLAFQKKKLSGNIFIFSSISIGIFGIFTALFLGHGNLLVALYGARILILHFPLIFVIGNIFSREDVIRLGKLTLWISIPMTVLIIFQFYSPQSDWVNLGVGGDEKGAGFRGALGYFRPPGTFSFTNGTSLFFGFSAAFVLYFWTDQNKINRFLLFASTTAVLLAIPFSISRTLFFYVILSLAFLMVAASNRPAYFFNLVFIVISCVLLLAFISQFSLVQIAEEVFLHRFETANATEGGLEGVFLDRFLGGMIQALTGSFEVPFWGYGSGMGTNVGSTILTGNRAFLIAEEEWGRLIGELGPLLGLLLITIRVSLGILISIDAFKNMRKGDALGWMLLSFGFITLTQGQWAQPTSLGFSTMIGGLMLAAVKNDERNDKKKNNEK